MTSPARVPLILDVDTGIDDALALLYACASPEAALVAVTCLSGNATAADVQRNTRAVLELATLAVAERSGALRRDVTERLTAEYGDDVSERLTFFTYQSNFRCVNFFVNALRLLQCDGSTPCFDKN